MTTENTELVDIADDLNDFEKSFFNPEAKTEEEDTTVDTEDDALETEEDTDAPEGDEDSDTDEDAEDEDEDESEDSEEEDEDEPEPDPKPKAKSKKSAQERINELTRQRYEIERRAQEREAELIRRLEAIEARERKESKSESITEKLPQGAPTPDATDEAGEPLYPLGEFDPAFITDLTRFTIAQETQALEQKRAEEAAAKELDVAKQELQAEWAQKLEEAEEDNPEIRENIAGLTDTFQNIDPAYGEYLAMIIMQSENGPMIMDYLSQNIGEAQKIVASGPAAATLAIGRLDARLTPRPKEEEKRNSKNVSHAPEPPEKVTRGRKGQRNLRPDTDNLEDFEKLYYG